MTSPRSSGQFMVEMVSQDARHSLLVQSSVRPLFPESTVPSPLEAPEIGNKTVLAYFLILLLWTDLSQFLMHNSDVLLVDDRSCGDIWDEWEWELIPPSQPFYWVIMEADPKKILEFSGRFVSRMSRQAYNSSNDLLCKHSDIPGLCPFSCVCPHLCGRSASGGYDNSPEAGFCSPTVQATGNPLAGSWTWSCSEVKPQPPSQNDRLPL